MDIRKFSIIFIIFLTLFSLGLRAYRLTEPNHYYFDEVYHAVTAKAYADNNPASYDPFSPAPKEGTAYDWLHPPMAKLIQAGTIKIFGDVPLGWRLPSVIFGTAIIPATFILANLLFGPVVAIFASSVVAFENLTFAMSRITMNDVFITFFAIVAFIFGTLYVKSTSGERRRTVYLFLSYLFLGFSIASKWTGVYAAVVIVGYILWNQIKNKRLDSRPLLLLVMLPIIYLFAYGQFWLQGHSLRQFIDLHKQIWWYQNRHDLEHSYGTTPLFCVPKGLNGPKTWCPWALNVRGVYFSYEQYGDKAGYIYALGNPLIFWGGVLAVAYVVGKYTETYRKEYALILLGYFIFWVPWVFSPRIMFMYHYLPSIPFMTIALGVALGKIYQSRLKYLAFAILLIFIVGFFYFYPISSGYPIDPPAIEDYMWIKKWR